MDKLDCEIYREFYTDGSETLSSVLVKYCGKVIC